MRTRRAALEIAHRPITGITAQPCMHRLARHPVPAGHITDHSPVQDLQRRPITHLRHTQLPQHGRPLPQFTNDYEKAHTHQRV